MSNSRLTTKPSKPPAAAISAGHQVVAHKSTGGMLTSFPQPVDPVGNASDRLTNNTVALPQLNVGEGTEPDLHRAAAVPNTLALPFSRLSTVSVWGEYQKLKL